MKKILLMCLIALEMIFTSCVTTKEYSYTSPIDYMNELKELNEYYNDKGFYLNGESWNTENDLHIEGYEYFINRFSINNNYGTQVGYGNVTQVVPNFKNDYLYKNTYKFQDSIGNTINFTLGYKIDKFKSANKIKVKNNWNHEDIEYIYYDEVIYSEVCDCETNDFNNYVDLCKNDKIQNFNNNLNKNSKTEIFVKDVKKTNTAVAITTSTFLLILAIIGFYTFK